MLSSGLTALYMARQWRLIFFGDYQNKEVPLGQAHEPDWLIRGPVLLLAILSVWVWFSVNPLSGHGSWFSRLFPAHEAEPFWWLAPVSIGLVLLGGWLGFRLKEPKAATGYVRLSVEYGFLDFFIRVLTIRLALRFAAFLNRMDQRVVDGVVNGAGVTTVVIAHITTGFDRLGVDGVVNGVAWLASRLGQLTRSIQNGRVQSYITVAVVGLLVVLWWLL
ncbi:MAG: hypothetical protein EOO39_50100 [Cytophagaceae bacterium]|nr:MAG: hypothetical protein EOO39_50100 [Cytophagaceae bacterium]